MPSQKKIRLFSKTKNLKNFLIPFLFGFTFFLIIFNKTDYLIVNQIKESGINIISPISKIISYPLNASIKTINQINSLRTANKEIIRLKEEITRLKKWQTLALKNTTENKAYKKLLNSTSSEYNIVKTASIINHPPKIYSKTIIINAGLNHKIEKNLAVINERGLVGKTILVSNNNAKVLLINDQNSSIPVKSISNDFNAVLSGTSDGKYLISSFIKDNKRPIVGDLLVTTGTANIFPKNILVGKIISISDEKLIALPFVDLKNLEFVQIISKN